MILYGIDNIRDLFGHKVSVLVLGDVSLDTYHDILTFCLQVSLNLIRKNPLCRLGL